MFLFSSNFSQISLRQWHNETQVYVGAFQYLSNKQHRIDIRRNLGKAKSTELKAMKELAKKLLCEIETAISNRGQQPPDVYTREAMDKELNFRSFAPNMHDEVDDLDLKFAKVRFFEYMHNLDRIMKCPRKNRTPCKKHRKNKRKYLCRKRDLNGKGANCTSIEPPIEMANTDSNGNRHPVHSVRRPHYRVRNGNGVHLSGNGGGGGAHLKPIFDANGNRLHRRQRLYGERRHRNHLNNQFTNETILHRNRRKKMHRTYDLPSMTTLTPFSLQ